MNCFCNSSDIPPVTAGNSMTSSERPSPEPILKKEASPAVLGGENSGNALEASNALNYRAWGIPAVLSREIPGNALRAFPGSLWSFRNFFRKVPAVLGVWPRNARLFIILFVRNFWRVRSQFWLRVRNSDWIILFEVVLLETQEEIHHFDGWEGGSRGTKIVNKIFVNKLAFPIFFSPLRVRVAHLQNEVGMKDFFRGTNFLTKDAPKFSPKIWALSGVIRANRFARFARITRFARIGNSNDSGELAWRAIKIEVSIANDSRESIRANRVANRPCH